MVFCGLAATFAAIIRAVAVLVINPILLALSPPGRAVVTRAVILALIDVSSFPGAVFEYSVPPFVRHSPGLPPSNRHRITKAGAHFPERCCTLLSLVCCPETSLIAGLLPGLIATGPRSSLLDNLCIMPQRDS